MIYCVFVLEVRDVIAVGENLEDRLMEVGDKSNEGIKVVKALETVLFLPTCYVSFCFSFTSSLSSDKICLAEKTKNADRFIRRSKLKFETK